MKKILATTLIAGMLAGTAATAQEIRPLDTTASSQLPGGIPPIAVGIGTALIIVAIVASSESDGT